LVDAGLPESRRSAGTRAPACRRTRNDYPCRCLCRGSEQTMNTTPRLRTILHLSHIRLTLARTFIEPFEGDRRSPRLPNMG